MENGKKEKVHEGASLSLIFLSLTEKKKKKKSEINKNNK